jgi:hypothetical protein
MIEVARSEFATGTVRVKIIIGVMSFGDGYVTRIMNPGLLSRVLL